MNWLIMQRLASWVSRLLLQVCFLAFVGGNACSNTRALRPCLDVVPRFPWGWVYCDPWLASTLKEWVMQGSTQTHHRPPSCSLTSCTLQATTHHIQLEDEKPGQISLSLALEFDSVIDIYGTGFVNSEPLGQHNRACLKGSNPLLLHLGQDAPLRPYPRALSYTRKTSTMAGRIQHGRQKVGSSEDIILRLRRI